MTVGLTRHWIPSPNYSGGSTKRLLVLHTTEGFTGQNGMYDCGYYFQGSGAGASSQVVIDNFHPGHIVECVSSGKGAWTQCNFNSVSVSAEQCGYASWSRSTWLNDKEPLLRNAAAWLAEESKRFGIPLTDLSASQAQGGSWGVCYHSELGSTGCGHSDPGGGYPLDVVLDWARGGGAPQPQPPKPELEEEEDMPSCLVPPKAVTGRAIGVSLPGDHKAMGICVDVTVLPDPHVHIRAAFHSNSGWEVIQVYADPENQKVVVHPSRPFHGASLTRMDDQDIDIIADFGK